MSCRAPRPGQRGTALLLAMIILTLVSTVAAGMVWSQQRAIEIEAAERARAQAAWILNGALDWSRLILREDARSGGSDHLGEPWAVPLAEARLSTFLAADRNTTEDDGPEAFLSGRIVDLQARYNLRGLIGENGEVVESELAVLSRLCALVGVPSGTAAQIADGLGDAWRKSGTTVSLGIQRLDQLAWLGIDRQVLSQLDPYVVVLPDVTGVNLNTAPREVIAALVEGLPPSVADRLIQVRQRNPFRTLTDADLPEPLVWPSGRAVVASRFFEVTGRLRLDDRVLEERSIIERRPPTQGSEVVAILRQRRSSLEPLR